MRAFNLHTADFEYPADNPAGYRRGHARVGEAIGSNRIGGTVYELPPGESAWPYHYELGDEEWMIVLDGRVAVRTPEGEQELGARRRRVLPRGPRRRAQDGQPRRRDGARPHALDPPLAGRRGLPRQREGRGLRRRPGRAVMVRRSSTVDYWDGES